MLFPPRILLAPPGIPDCMGPADMRMEAESPESGNASVAEPAETTSPVRGWAIVKGRAKAKRPITRMRLRG